MKKYIAFLAAMALTAGFAYAASEGMVHSIKLPEKKVEMKPGPGLQKVEALCNICHSLDYIPMQPRLSKAQWSAEVHKMIKVMGAPINEADAETIINYLAAEYGTGK